MSSKRAIMARIFVTSAHCSGVQADLARREIEVSTLTAGKAALVGDGAFENDVAVERAADVVGDGIVVIVAVDKHGEHARDRAGAFLAGTGTLEKLRQVAEDTRRIAARDRRLARSQGHIAGGMGKARHRIDDEQHLLAPVAEIFRDAHRRLRRQAAHHRAFIAGGDHGDGVLALLLERVLQEVAHLASALADQRDDGSVEAAGAREHGEQRRLADAGARENADALAGAERREEVDDPDARS